MALEGMVGELRVFSYNLMPRNWQACNGDVLLKIQNEALFSLIGNLYGGDGQRTFALPDLRGRVPINPGSDILLAKNGGEENHSLTPGEMAAHTHQASGMIGAADYANPENQLWASNTGQFPFSDQANTTMASQTIDYTGSGTGHDNMSPYLALNYGICTQGFYGNREGTIGEILMYAGKYIPDQQSNWALCDGRTMNLTENTELFALLGKNFGGNGTSNFKLPDLRGVAAIQCGQGDGLSNRELGRSGGSATVSLTPDQLAEHSHQVLASSVPATTSDPNSATWGTGGQVRGGVPLYTGSGSVYEMNAAAITETGRGIPHNNMSPYLGINFLICLAGKFPPNS